MSHGTLTYGRRWGLRVGTAEHFEWLYGIAKGHQPLSIVPDLCYGGINIVSQVIIAL